MPVMKRNIMLDSEKNERVIWTFYTKKFLTIAQKTHQNVLNMKNALSIALLPFSSVQFSSVQFSCSVMSDSLRPHESQHARPPCPSPKWHWIFTKNVISRALYFHWRILPNFWSINTNSMQYLLENRKEGNTSQFFLLS